MTLQERYKECIPMGVCSTSAFSGLLIMDEDTVNDKILVCDELRVEYTDMRQSYRWHKLYINNKGVYFVRCRNRYYLSDFIRVSKRE